jgi:hypothetical protein
MPLFTLAALKLIAQGALTSAIGPFVEEAREASLNVAQDTIRGIIGGRMSLEEWANIEIKGVDKVKDRIVNESEGNLNYVGGKMNFALSQNNARMVTVSFQLYFQDTNQKWHKAEADSNIPISKFKTDSFEELQSKDEISFEVE